MKQQQEEVRTHSWTELVSKCYDWLVNVQNASFKKFFLAIFQLSYIAPIFIVSVTRVTLHESFDNMLICSITLKHIPLIIMLFKFSSHSASEQPLVKISVPNEVDFT